MHDQDHVMEQPFLKMPNLHCTVNRAHVDLVAKGARIAAEVGLVPCGPVSWSNRLRGKECIDLTVYRPMHGSGERYAVKRFFDGCYASVTCLLPEHAKRALLADSRAEFEQICAAGATVRADGPSDASKEDLELVALALLSTDIDAQHPAARVEAQQLPLF
jgi:hypothetical protein